jgi:hypothetical protein
MIEEDRVSGDSEAACPAGLDRTPRTAQPGKREWASYGTSRRVLSSESM